MQRHAKLVFARNRIIQIRFSFREEKNFHGVEREWNVTGERQIRGVIGKIREELPSNTRVIFNFDPS